MAADGRHQEPPCPRRYPFLRCCPQRVKGGGHSAKRPFAALTHCLCAVPSDRGAAPGTCLRLHQGAMAQPTETYFPERLISSR
jgi:hypothetical protein